MDLRFTQFVLVLWPLWRIVNITLCEFGLPKLDIFTVSVPASTKVSAFSAGAVCFSSARFIVAMGWGCECRRIEGDLCIPLWVPCTRATKLLLLVIGSSKRL